MTWFKKKPDAKKDVIKEISNIEKRFEVFRIGIALLISMVLIILVIALISDNPLGAIRELLLGPLQSLRRIGNVIELMIPLTFTGLAITMVFKTNRFNLAAEGAFYMATMVAVLVALNSPFPPVITIILGLLAGFIVGGLLGLIPALINLKFGANELVVSLMQNYIVAFFVQYLLNYVVRDPNSYAIQSYALPESVSLFRFIPGTRIHVGLILMAVVVVVAYIILYRTKWGYVLRVTGLNEKFAKYSGVKVAFVIIIAQVLGTAIAGLGGAVEMYGIYNTFKFAASPGYGWDGIIVATLAKLNPAFVPLAALFIAYIRVGADILNRSTNIPPEIVSIVQAIIILFIAAKAFMKAAKEKKIVEKSREVASEGAN